MSGVLGIDVGSREVKIAMVEHGAITFSTKMDTVQFYIACRNGGRELNIDRLSLLSDAPVYEKIVATGYGRNNVNVKGGVAIPEIMAHAKGAMFQTGLTDFTLVDIGGQDTKVISVKDGFVDDFSMNDKCAAGSGRYLENIARALGVSIEKLGECADDPLGMSNTCAIFGESEVIGLISDGEPIENILAGANRTVVMRLVPMIRKYRNRNMVLTGGVAKNGAIRQMIESETNMVAHSLPHPQINGAIGCCVSSG